MHLASGFSRLRTLLIEYDTPRMFPSHLCLGFLPSLVDVGLIYLGLSFTIPLTCKVLLDLLVYYLMRDDFGY